MRCFQRLWKGKENGKGAFIWKEEYLIESFITAPASLWAGLREQTFAGSSRTKAVFPSKGSGFSSSEKSFVSTVIGRKNCMTIVLESCTHHQLECKLLWQNLTEECSIAMQNSKELLI